MKERLTIGEISSLTSISARSLRHWDKLDLFKPQEIDKTTGYRYYSTSQMHELFIVKGMQSIGIPLKEIKSHIEQRNLDSYLNLIKDQEILARQKAEEFWAIAKRLQEEAREIEESRVNPKLNIPYIMQFPERKVIFWDENIKCRVDFEISIVKIKKIISPQSTERVVVSVSKNNILNGKLEEYNGVFVFSQDESSHSKIFPAGEYVCIHSWELLFRPLSCYKIIMDFIDENSYEIQGDAIWRAILPSNSKEKPEHLAELQIPVKKKNIQ